jgi:hypothetical protein
MKGKKLKLESETWRLLDVVDPDGQMSCSDPHIKHVEDLIMAAKVGSSQIKLA